MGNKKLMLKGEKVPLAKVVDQAGVSLATYNDPKLKAALDAVGFAPSAVRMAEVLGLLKSERAQAIDGRAASKDKTVLEENARHEAKGYKRVVTLAADDLVADDEMTDADRAAFNRGRIGQSTPKIIQWLIDTTDVVTRYAGQLSPLLGGIDVPARHQEVLANLQTAQSTQEVSVDALPAETQEIYALKGELLSLIEKLNRAGKRAFDGNALVLARFNKDVLLRGGSGAGRKVEEPEQPAA